MSYVEARRKAVDEIHQKLAALVEEWHPEGDVHTPDYTDQERQDVYMALRVLSNGIMNWLNEGRK